VANNNSKARLARTGEFASEHVRIQERYIFDPAANGSPTTRSTPTPRCSRGPSPSRSRTRRITAATPQDGWNNVDVPRQPSGSEPIIEAWERVCAENNGPHGDIAAAP
jgi:hypothetical protein